MTQNRRKYLSSSCWFLLFILFNITVVLGGNGGSTYSRYGLGDIQYFISSRAVGMGGAGIGVLSSSSINQLNPATWTQINRTRFSLGGVYEGFATKDDKRSAYLSGTFFNGLMIAIPVATKSGVVFGMGIVPLTRVNYNVVTTSSFESLPYNIRYLGDGGLSEGQLGLSGKIGDDIHLGTKFNYYFGTLNYSSQNTLSGSNTPNGEVMRSMEIHGMGLSLGGVYSGLNKILNLSGSKMLNVGLIFTTTSNLVLQEEKFYAFRTTIVSYDTTTSERGKVKFPYSLGFGASYLAERMLVAADLFYQQWTNYRVNGNPDNDLRNSYRIGIGGELLPRHDASATYYQRIAYRFGLFYYSTYYKIKSEPINEVGISGGFGLPIFGDSRLDVGAEYSFRGTTDKQLQKDKLIRLSITLSGSELWFERPEQE